MAHIKAWIEAHPYLSGSLAIALITLFFVLRSSGSTAPAASGGTSGINGSGLSEGGYVSLSEAQLQAGAAQQQNQNAATVANNTVNAQVAATQIEANADVVKAALAQQAELQQTITSGQVTMGANNLSAQVALAQTGAQVTLAGFQSDLDKQKETDSYTTGLYALNSQAQVASNNFELAQGEQQIQINQQTNQFAIDQSLISTIGSLKGGG